ncbi:MAG: methyltransferase domain-containing protein [Pirellulales bacterium]
MRRFLGDYGLFLKEFGRTFHTTGALFPSSPLLARALSRYVGAASADTEDGAGPRSGPRRILEVGPGTGAVTRSIVKRMGQTDQLELVELNDRFVERLRRGFENDPLLNTVVDRATVHHKKIQDVEQHDHYDVIVSGLPLNNFSVEDVAAILDKFKQLLKKPGGTLSFFEYIAVRPLRSVIAGRAERQRLRDVGRALSDVFRDFEIRRQSIWINIPPAWVHHVRFD